ncbi:MAG: response regulator [Lachnospiraceae bacterium]|nr:response regulator [Lachnospiraceae bacterium]
MAKRILVVDDDMMCLKSVQRYLTDEGFDVIGALSGMQAVHIVEETKIDLLLLDIEMPGLSGFATFEQIRELNNGRQLPVIFFTGRKDRDTVKRCAAIGAEGYITKPVVKSALLSRVEEVFSHMVTAQEERTILIVDDDIELLKQWKISLSEHYKVIAVNSVKTALDYLNSHKADVILLDCDMQIYEGESFVNVLAKKEETKDIPVIVLYEGDGELVENERKANPVGAYLKKNVTSEELLKIVQSQFD